MSLIQDPPSPRAGAEAGAEARKPDEMEAGTRPAGVAAKAPPPGLLMRAPRPPVTRLRKSVVQVLVLGGAILVSGSLAWAFVIQPEMRDGARARAADDREELARGAVRPSEAVTGQPATYDRLPEPRTSQEPDSESAAGANFGPTARPDAPVYQPRLEKVASGPGPGELAARSALFFGPGPGGSVPAAAATRPQARGRDDRDLGATYNGHVLTAPLSPYELKAGSIIPAVLLTGVDTSRPGPVVATVSQDVFDTVSGRHLVLPQGTRLVGRHEGDSAYGDRRAFLAWDRLILPNGKSLVLTAEPGVDAQGAVGVAGSVDRRLLPLLVGTLFAGAVTTLGQVARDSGEGGGILGDAGDAAAIEASQVGGRLVDRELQVRPSIRLRPGAAVRAMITRDLILEPYQP